MKSLFLGSCMALMVSAVLATEQESDFIIYEKKRCELETNWLFSSPLQAFFESHKDVTNPFEATSTGNYRGHVATWEIADGRLFLTALAPSNPGSQDSLPNDQAEGWSKAKMKEIFAAQINPQGKVSADWYSGHLRVFTKPVKRKYKHEDEEAREVTEFTEIVLLAIKDGRIVRETAFPVRDYWDKFGLLAKLKHLDPKEIEAINEHIQFLEQHDKDWDRIAVQDSTDRVHNESEFPAFLTRQLETQVDIPLTKFVIIKDCSVDFSKQSWVISSDLRVKPGMNLLMLEMGAINVPRGPWSAHTGGSVQILIQLGELKSKSMEVSGQDKRHVRFINNFSHSKENLLEGSLKIDLGKDGKPYVTGTLNLTSKSPTTFQKMAFEKDRLPVTTIQDDLKREYGEDGSRAEEAYQEILRESQPSPKSE